MSSELLIEVRCEELPHAMIGPALSALESGVKALLKGVEHGESRVFSTPRRLAVCVSDVAEGRPLTEQLVTGPPLAAAQRDGVWTKAAEGFARGRGVPVEELEVVEGPRGPVVAATVRQGGDRSADLIAAGLEKLVLGLPFKKAMRWGARRERWGRPIHQVVAVLDGRRLVAEVAGIETSDVVVGHRRSRLAPVPVIDGPSYLAALEQRWVLADRSVRRATLVTQGDALASVEGLRVDWDPDLLEEVTDLLEWPMALLARFDEDLLKLPGRLLIESMKVHQRYFPTYDAEGALTNVFVVVSNNPTGDAELIATGNARVLRARFYDARFFFAEDRKRTLQELGADLATMRWVRKLGTMADKQARVASLAVTLSTGLGLSQGEQAGAAGAVCKCDLLSQMVGEFAKLQGHIGHLYALNQGFDPVAAGAIEEHYLPRYAGDDLPASDAGRALAIADRLDTLAGCFGIGLKPKASADPQGLRRAANGILAVLLDAGLRCQLGELIELAAANFEAKADTSELVEFVLARLRAMLQAEGHATDIVDAVLAAGGQDPVQIAARVRGLTALSRSGEFGPLAEAFKRVLNISKDHTDTVYDRDLFQARVEDDLASAFEAARDEVPRLVDQLQVEAALSRCVQLKPAIDAYFDVDGVMVMAEDPSVRATRLGLVTSIARLFLSVADFRVINSERT
jgi:glycyl-tRNA synthetase beta chain